METDRVETVWQEVAAHSGVTSARVINVPAIASSSWNEEICIENLDR